MKGDRWTHNICYQCWTHQEPDREPVHVLMRDPDGNDETCCWCGKATTSGIFKRARIDDVPLCPAKKGE